MGITDMTSERRCVGHVALIPEIKGTKIISPDLIKLCPQIPKKIFIFPIKIWWSQSYNLSICKWNKCRSSKTRAGYEYYDISSE